MIWSSGGSHSKTYDLEFDMWSKTFKCAKKKTSLRGHVLFSLHCSFKWISVFQPFWFKVFELKLVWPWEEQLLTKSVFFLLADCYLLLWLCFSATSLNMRLLAHTHTHTPALQYWLKQTVNTHTFRQTHTCALLVPSPAVFCQWCTCSFLSSKMFCKTYEVWKVINQPMYLFFSCWVFYYYYY